MKYILNESQYKKLISEIAFSPEVVLIQKDLIDKGYDLGNYGPNKDGVDGKAGPLTKAAYEKEYGKEISVDSEKSSEEPSVSEFDAVLVGGLDNRPGDLSIDSQVELLKQGLGSDKRVKGFRFNTPTSTITDFMSMNPQIPIYLFSAGCRKANELATNKNVNKSKLYIIEPYAAGKITKYSVRDSVSSGVPASNVFIGNSVGRGSGIVQGASPSNSPSHWGALKSVGKTTKQI